MDIQVKKNYGNDIWQDYTTELKKTINKYGDNFGGVFIWEYYDAPPTWYLDIEKIFNNTSQVCCIN